MEALFLLKTRAQSFLQNDRGLVAWEHLLVIAGVSVAIIFAVGVAGPSLTSAVMNGTCKSMNTIFETARHPRKASTTTRSRRITARISVSELLWRH